jgi:hypothetical protein
LKALNKRFLFYANCPSIFTMGRTLYQLTLDGHFRQKWETDINHPTRQVAIRLVFPNGRPPLRVALVENIRQSAACAARQRNAAAPGCSVTLAQGTPPLDDPEAAPRDRPDTGGLLMDYDFQLWYVALERGYMPENNASKTVKAGSTTYFFDIKESKAGKPFLVITESRFKGEGSERRRSSIVVFPEQIKEFASALRELETLLG